MDSLAPQLGQKSMNAGQKVLICDDDPILLEVYGEVLTGLPSRPEVHTAMSGALALEVLEAEPFDLFLCNLHMPGMNGFEVLATVRRKHPRLRTVILTGATEERFRSRAYALGVDLFCNKFVAEQEAKPWFKNVESLLTRERVPTESTDSSDHRRLCWGDCGHWLYFKRLGQARQRWDVAFQLCTDRAHTCPRRNLPPLFLPGMKPCEVSVECDVCHTQIYEVPIRPRNREEDVVRFEKLDWPWAAHFCPKHDDLRGIADISPKNLSEQCSKLNLPEPYRLVLIVCVKEISGPDALLIKATPSCSPTCKSPIERAPLYIIALKGVLGERFCCFFRGSEKPRWGDLAALCGSSVEPMLLINSGHVLTFDGQAEPADLRLSWDDSGSRTRECSACRKRLRA